MPPMAAAVVRLKPFDRKIGTRLMMSAMLTMAIIKVAATSLTKCKDVRSRRKAGSHHDLRAGIFAAAGPLGPTLGAVGLRALALALEKNMNSIGIPATAAMPPGKEYGVRRPKSPNTKTVHRGTKHERSREKRKKR